MLSAIFFGCVAALIAAYLLYGTFLKKRFDLDDSRQTPARLLEDGHDYCPARRPVLFGHHFSSIAGAGPIVGPVLAAIAFGWLPALLWIVLGAIFIGGVHDMGSLVASIRHKARSVAAIARENITPRAGKLFLLFIWLALVLVLAAFIDLTASTFVADGGVATSAGIYILLALVFGICLHRSKLTLGVGTLIFVPLVFAAIWAGQQYPLSGAEGAGAHGMHDIYVYVLAAYCFIASIAPVWVLLQPRDYLSSFLLYACLLGGGAGVILSGAPIEYPAFVSLEDEALGFLLPALFITVACGACSGFHSIVASGTTAKQLARESDARPVGYGAMLVEGLLAIIALAAVMVCATGSAELEGPATKVFANGLGRFLSSVGVAPDVGAAFGLLAISTFLLTTLDTATRLARYVFEELVGARVFSIKIAATILTLGVPLLIVAIPVESGGKTVPAYKMIWPIFGATNQLLGGLALLTVAVWLKRSGRKTYRAVLFVMVPMAFMIIVTVFALVQILIRTATSEEGLSTTASIVRFSASSLLLLLSLVLISEAVRSLGSANAGRDPKSGREEP